MGEKGDLYVSKTKKMMITALFTAMVFVVTMISIPIPFGFLNIGDALIMLLAITIPLPMSMFIAGVGSMMADFALGWSQYAIFTLVIKSLEAALVYVLYHRVKSMNRFLPFVVGGLWIVLMYGFTDVFLYQSWFQLIPSMSYNVFQGVGSAMIAMSLSGLMVRHMSKLFKE